MKNRCGNSSPDPASSRVVSPPEKRLKSTSTLTSGGPLLGSKLQETELRNINAEFFPQSCVQKPGSTWRRPGESFLTFSMRLWLGPFLFFISEMTCHQLLGHVLGVD